MLRLAWAMLLAIALAGPVIAQSTDSTMVALREAYQQMDYIRAEQEAYTILESFETHTAQELTEAHVTLAIIQYTQSNWQQSQNHFEAALSLSPELELDARDVSPKIRAFYEEVREGLQPSGGATESQEIQLRYIYVEDPRAGAIWRSMVVPGWGQLYAGENKKGLLFAGGWVALAGATAGLHAARSRAQDRYQKATDPLRIEAQYESYNRLHKLRNSAALAAVGLWLGSYLDALHKKKAASPRSPLVTASLTPSPYASAPAFHVTFTF